MLIKYLIISICELFAQLQVMIFIKLLATLMSFMSVFHVCFIEVQ